MRVVEVKNADVLLLCTDGLTTMMPDEEIRECLVRSAADVERAAQQLVDGANEHGGEDNVTVLVIRFES
jgi:protein phosphatase